MRCVEKSKKKGEDLDSGLRGWLGLVVSLREESLPVGSSQARREVRCRGLLLSWISASPEHLLSSEGRGESEGRENNFFFFRLQQQWGGLCRRTDGGGYGCE